jgi:hypothetical protein
MARVLTAMRELDLRAEGAEQCSCGASMRWRGGGARAQVREWRREHRCMPQDDDSGPDGAGTKASLLERPQNRVGFRWGG